MNLNRVTVAGRLTRDPEVRYTTSGTAVAEISLAVSRFYKDQAGQTKEETDFIDLTAFGRSAEVMQKHLHKGNPLFVEGRLHLYARS
jgi:single-strand DNA-binding protein